MSYSGGGGVAGKQYEALHGAGGVLAIVTFIINSFFSHLAVDISLLISVDIRLVALTATYAHT